MQEDALDPRWHGVRTGGPMVNVEHTNAGDDRESDQHHCKH